MKFRACLSLEILLQRELTQSEISPIRILLGDLFFFGGGEERGRMRSGSACRFGFSLRRFRVFCGGGGGWVWEGEKEASSKVFGLTPTNLLDSPPSTSRRLQKEAPLPPPPSPPPAVMPDGTAGDGGRRPLKIKFRSHRRQNRTSA